MIAENSVYARAQFETRRRYSFPIENETEVWLVLPEDIIIIKHPGYLPCFAGM
jgi:hypothetical protein